MPQNSPAKHKYGTWRAISFKFIICILNHSLTQTFQTEEKLHQQKHDERKAARRHSRNTDRHDRDEYELEDSEDEFKPKAPMMLEAPSTAGASSHDQVDYSREHKDRRSHRDGERESQYAGSSAGRSHDYSER